VRQARLRAEFRRSDYLHLPTPLNADLDLVIAKIEEFGLEGIVAKRKDSLYVPGKASAHGSK
jgi:ATP-dependent DNA ligase